MLGTRGVRIKGVFGKNLKMRLLIISYDWNHAFGIRNDAFVCISVYSSKEHPD